VGRAGVGRAGVHHGGVHHGAAVRRGVAVGCHCRKLNPTSKWSRIG
jgi:hypothetical protein